MKALKIIFITLLVLIAILLIVALFVKKDYAVEREIVINRPEAVVFDYIRHLKNQDNYAVWNLKDPAMKKTYTGTDGTVGFVAAWESRHKEVGKGEQEIAKIAEGERIDFKLRFKEPFEANDDAYMTTEPIGDNQTKVKWGFKGAFSYPMNIMNLLLDMDKAVGKDFGEGLVNLKKVLEQP